MNWRDWNYLSLAAMFLVGGRMVAHPEEPVRQRGAPIIFSVPKSDTASTNLNQLDAKASPFRNLESDLKKPFQIFDSGSSGGSFRPPAGLTDPPAAPVSNRRIKERMDKRAEMMVLEKDGGDRERADDDLLTTEEEMFGAAGKKIKTPIERYYDQLDRERLPVTNQVSKTDLFGNQIDPGGEESAGWSFFEHPFDSERKASARALSRMSNNASNRGGFSPENLKPKSFDDLVELQQVKELSDRSSEIKESRLDDYKRLLGGSSYTPRNNDYSPSLPAFGTAPRPATASPSPAWSLPSATPASRDSFTSRAGLVGAPAQLQSLPSFGSTTPGFNSAPAPVAQPKPPTSTFSLPKRQF